MGTSARQCESRAGDQFWIKCIRCKGKRERERDSEPIYSLHDAADSVSDIVLLLLLIDGWQMNMALARIRIPNLNGKSLSRQILARAHLARVWRCSMAAATTVRARKWWIWIRNIYLIERLCARTWLALSSTWAFRILSIPKVSQLDPRNITYVCGESKLDSRTASLVVYTHGKWQHSLEPKTIARSHERNLNNKSAIIVSETSGSVTHHYRRRRRQCHYQRHRLRLRRDQQQQQPQRRQNA